MLSACVGHEAELDLTSVADLPAIVSGTATEACVVGYVVVGEGVYLNSSKDDADLTSVAVIPMRRNDAIAMAAYRSKRVRLCGQFSADKECFSGERICTPRSKLLNLLRLRSINAS
jgi:hypothetical protein